MLLLVAILPLLALTVLPILSEIGGLPDVAEQQLAKRATMLLPLSAVGLGYFGLRVSAAPAQAVAGAAWPLVMMLAARRTSNAQRRAGSLSQVGLAGTGVWCASTAHPGGLVLGVLLIGAAYGLPQAIRAMLAMTAQRDHGSSSEITPPGGGERTTAALLTQGACESQEAPAPRAQFAADATRSTPPAAGEPEDQPPDGSSTALPQHPVGPPFPCYRHREREKLDDRRLTTLPAALEAPGLDAAGLFAPRARHGAGRVA